MEEILDFKRLSKEELVECLQWVLDQEHLVGDTKRFRLELASEMIGIEMRGLIRHKQVLNQRLEQADKVDEAYLIMKRLFQIDEECNRLYRRRNGIIERIFPRVNEMGKKEEMR